MVDNAKKKSKGDFSQNTRDTTCTMVDITTINIKGKRHPVTDKMSVL